MASNLYSLPDSLNSPPSKFRQRISRNAKLFQRSFVYDEKKKKGKGKEGISCHQARNNYEESRRKIVVFPSCVYPNHAATKLKRNLFPRMWPLRRPLNSVDFTRHKVPSFEIPRAMMIICENRVALTENSLSWPGEAVEKRRDERKEERRQRSGAREESFRTRRSVLPCYRNQILRKEERVCSMRKDAKGWRCKNVV